MERYKKYKTIHRISYIVFFTYLLILALSNFTFGENTTYIPYLIIIPFLIYCTIAITVTILIRKTRMEENSGKEIKEKHGRAALSKV